MEIELETRRITSRAAPTAEELELLKAARFEVPKEPAGVRAVVVECQVDRQQDASYGEHDDDIRFAFVMNDAGAAETVSMVWHENIAPTLDSLRRGDVVWALFRGASLIITIWDEVWQSALRTVDVLGRAVLPQGTSGPRPEWKFPVQAGPSAEPGLERLVIANRALAVKELRCEVSLFEVLSALEGTTRMLPLEVWSALALEVLAACERNDFPSLAAIKTGLKWDLTGAVSCPVTDQLSPSVTLSVACEALVSLMVGNTPVSARARRSAVPSTLSDERADAVRALLAKLGGVEFRSLAEVEVAVRALAVPAAPDVTVGVLFSLVPRVVEMIRVLSSHPELLPVEWAGVYAPPLTGAAALMVLSDRWQERRVLVESLPGRALPPIKPYVAPPKRVSAARPDAPEEEPLKSRFKWPWQK